MSCLIFNPRKKKTKITSPEVLRIEILEARYEKAVWITTFLGILVSIYAYSVETQLEKKTGYEPLCDISEHMSCSKAFLSPYGRGFGLAPKESFFDVPNSAFGMIYYGVLFILLEAFPHWTRLQLLLIIPSNLSSIYFAYILIFILEDFCLVCVTIYIVNAMSLFFLLKRRQYQKKLDALNAIEEEEYYDDDEGNCREENDKKED